MKGQRITWLNMLRYQGKYEQAEEITTKKSLRVPFTTSSQRTVTWWN
jgi:hypothetical protein